MSPQASDATWWRVIEQAHKGDARHLLELLLLPTVTDGKGQPLPGAFTSLPDDGQLRWAIVDVLIFGPWKEAAHIDDLMLKTGWGSGKPTVSDFVVDAAAAVIHLSGKELDVHDMAEGIGITGETLRKRIAKRRRPLDPD